MTKKKDKTVAESLKELGKEALKDGAAGAVVGGLAGGPWEEWAQ